ncbi:MAG TPA: toll/interleukin-1 receptor domain-containing protein, partial [Thermomicrobiales bacterium]|nr:toll/interleukin-1 receptor domain-containing protein [Thermomicrobiales bacterium]
MPDRRHPAEPFVFVSYASQDRERVLPIVETLRAAGITVWLDQHAIDGGANWGREIADAIEGCSAFLLMSSAASLASRNVRQEIAIAWKYGRPYLPLLLDATPIPREIEYFLEMAQWVELLDQPQETWLPLVLRSLERHDIVAGDAVILDDAPGTVDRSLPETPSLVPSAPAEFVGRERELAELRAALAASVAGQGQVALV